MKKIARSELKRTYNRPHVLAWVAVKHGERQTICPVGWHMQTSHQPLMMAVSLHPNRFAHELLREARAFVLAFPGEDMAEATLELGTKSGRDYDKFATHGLTVLNGELGQPLIAECLLNMECKVIGALLTGDHTIFAGEVAAIWQSEDSRRPLLSVDDAAGYDQLLAAKAYQFGAVKR
ncbi:flavin reductase family protein [Candidatus Sumerlaeota bacterium]